MNIFFSLVLLWPFLAEVVTRSTPVPSLVSGDVGGGEHLVNGTVYLVSTKRYSSLFSAANHCNRWGGKIASIPDQETFDLFKRLTANHYYKSPFFWIGVFSDCVRETLLVSMNDSRAYSNCSAVPDDCYNYGAGPQDNNDVLLEAENVISSCAFTKWVDFDGNNVTFLPFGRSTPHLGHHCTSMDVFDCENEDGCRIGEYSNHECFPFHRHRFICEKPVEKCQTFMEVPNVTNHVPFDFGSFRWHKFFGGNIQCGSGFVRIVINECAKRYVDLRGIRLDDPSRSGEECFATNGNVLTAALGSGTCGANSTYFGNGTYLDYYYQIHGHLGRHGPPLPTDVIRRDTPVTMYLLCDYLAVDFSELQTNFTVNRSLSYVERMNSGQLTASMSAYRDESLTMPLASHLGTAEVMVPDNIYVQAVVEDDDLTLQFVSCWASNSSAFNKSDAAFYTLIDGCVTVDASFLPSTGPNSVEFSFSSFVIGSHMSSDIYIHCTVHFCDAASGCLGCGGKKRRDLSQNKKSQVSIGPIRIISNYAKAIPKDTTPEETLDLCEQKNCAHECRILGDRALCNCPPGMLVDNDGKSCVRLTDVSKWIWDDTIQENNKINNGVSFKRPTDKQQKLLNKSSVYVGLGAFILSSVLCVTAYKMWRSQVRSKRFSNI